MCVARVSADIRDQFPGVASAFALRATADAVAHPGYTLPVKFVIASEAKQSMSPLAETWIASSLSLLAMTSAGKADSHIKQRTHAIILAARRARVLHHVRPSQKIEGAGKAGCRSHPWAPCR